MFRSTTSLYLGSRTPPEIVTPFFENALRLPVFFRRGRRSGRGQQL